MRPLTRIADAIPPLPASGERWEPVARLYRIASNELAARQKLVAYEESRSSLSTRNHPRITLRSIRATNGRGALMKHKAFLAATLLIPALALSNPFSATGQTTMLPAPGFHHLHLNSVDPDAAIDFYTRQFPSTSKSSWGGMPALKSPNNVLILFTKVATPPPTSPPTAIWHFGWHAVDSRKSLETYKARPDVKLLPLYTTDEGGSVLISSDTWPGAPGVLGLTKAEIADAKAKGVQPARTRGFAYMQGPDAAIIEISGNFPAERFNHVHMFQEHPFCAQIWYQKHLNAPVVQDRAPATPMTEANCQVPRGPDPTWP